MALAALAVLASTLLGGAVYVWCAPMARAMLHACCPSDHASEGAIEQPCCEAHRVDAMPSFAAGYVPTPWVAPPPLVAVIALALLYAVATWGAPMRRVVFANPPRAGPGRRRFLTLCTLRN